METFIYDPIKNRKNEHTQRIHSNLKRIFYLSKVLNVLQSLEDIHIDEHLLQVEMETATSASQTHAYVFFIFFFFLFCC